MNNIWNRHIQKVMPMRVLRNFRQRIRSNISEQSSFIVLQVPPSYLKRAKWKLYCISQALTISLFSNASITICYQLSSEIENYKILIFLKSALCPISLRWNTFLLLINWLELINSIVETQSLYFFFFFAGYADKRTYRSATKIILLISRQYFHSIYTIFEQQIFFCVGNEHAFQSYILYELSIISFIFWSSVESKSELFSRFSETILACVSQHSFM